MSGLPAILIEPFAHDFMARALVVGLMVAVVCALLSCFVVLRGWSLMGDAVSHAVLPGVVLASFASLPIAVGAFAAGFACAALSGYLRENSRVKEDAALGVVFSGMFALGLVLHAKLAGEQHVTHILFGNLLGVSWREVVETAAIALPVVLLVLAKRRDLTLLSFDPAHAQAIGLPAQAWRYALLAMIALAVVASVKAVGVVLVVAMLIAPGATGFLLARRMGPMMLAAAASALLATVIGVLASFHLDAATGPLIVVAQSLIFWLAVGWRMFKTERAGAGQAHRRRQA